MASLVPKAAPQGVSGILDKRSAPWRSRTLGPRNIITHNHMRDQTVNGWMKGDEVKQRQRDRVCGRIMREGLMREMEAERVIRNCAGCWDTCCCKGAVNWPHWYMSDKHHQVLFCFDLVPFPHKKRFFKRPKGLSDSYASFKTYASTHKPLKVRWKYFYIYPLFILF